MKQLLIIALLIPFLSRAQSRADTGIIRFTTSHWSEAQMDPRDGHVLATRCDTCQWTIIDGPRYAQYMDSMQTALCDELYVIIGVRDAALELVKNTPQLTWTDADWKHAYRLQDLLMGAFRKQNAFYRLKNQRYVRQIKSHHLGKNK